MGFTTTTIMAHRCRSGRRPPHHRNRDGGEIDAARSLRALREGKLAPRRRWRASKSRFASASAGESRAAARDLHLIEIKVEVDRDHE
jgi:hypothetical protein